MECIQMQYVVLIKMIQNISHVITDFLQIVQNQHTFKIDGVHK